MASAAPAGRAFDAARSLQGDAAMERMRRIAIVGGGASGIGAAWGLTEAVHRVTLIERAPALRWLERRGGRVLPGARVESIVRGRDQVQLRMNDASGLAAPLVVDDVVLALNAHQVLPLLADATADERVALAGIRWQAARVVVHRDPRLMPVRRDAWGAFNYLVADEPAAAIAGPTVTFYSNRLAGLPAACPDVCRAPLGGLLLVALVVLRLRRRRVAG